MLFLWLFKDYDLLSILCDSLRVGWILLFDVFEYFLLIHERIPSFSLVQRCLNNSEKQCLIFVTGQGGGRRQCGGIVD